MIQSFANKTTAALFSGQFIRELPRQIQIIALKKLQLIDAAIAIEDLSSPPSNYLEKLKGKRKNQWSIRINIQWRICFEFLNGNAFDVEVIDYH